MHKGLLNPVASLFLLIFMVLPVFNASATRSRINAMGGRTKFITVEDESNALIFPATLVRWGDLALLDTIGKDQAGNFRGEFGVHYRLNDKAVVGLYGSNLESRTFTFGANGAAVLSGVPPAAVTGTFDQPNELSNFKGALGFAYDLGPVDLGVMLGISADNAQTQDADGNTVSQFGPLGIRLDLGLGADLDSKGRTSHIDFGVGLEFATFDSTQDGVETFSPDNFFGVDSTVRLILETTDTTQVIPYVRFAFLTEGVNNNAGDIGVDTNRTGVDAGVDLHIEPAEGVSIYPGIGVSYDTLQTKVRTTTGRTEERDNTVIPFFSLGLDARLTGWLDFRIGGVQRDSFISDQNGTTKGKVKQSSSEVFLTTGVGLHFMGLTIDLNVQPQFFNNGPNFVSGNTTDPFAVDAAIKYAW